MQSLRYLSGQAQIAQGEEQEALARAKVAVEKFAVIGFVEALDDFVGQFEAVFGVCLTVGRYNVGKRAELEISARDRRRLEAACAAELELHEFVRAWTARRHPAARIAI